MIRNSNRTWQHFLFFSWSGKLHGAVTWSKYKHMIFTMVLYSSNFKFVIRIIFFPSLQQQMLNPKITTAIKKFRFYYIKHLLGIILSALQHLHYHPHPQQQKSNMLCFVTDQTCHKRHTDWTAKYKNNWLIASSAKSLLREQGVHIFTRNLCTHKNYFSKEFLWFSNWDLPTAHSEMEEFHTGVSIFTC